MVLFLISDNNNFSYIYNIDILRLNEGFARYMQFIGTNSVMPGWKMVN